MECLARELAFRLPCGLHIRIDQCGRTGSHGRRFPVLVFRFLFGRGFRVRFVAWIFRMLFGHCPKKAAPIFPDAFGIFLRPIFLESALDGNSRFGFHFSVDAALGNSRNRQIVFLFSVLFYSARSSRIFRPRSDIQERGDDAGASMGTFEAFAQLLEMVAARHRYLRNRLVLGLPLFYDRLCEILRPLGE